ncbi:helix-turn-helix domain-containing protein [Ciceribacter sp. RN22]|uniref:helix-turn-helix domain-containing protein n=1 Tax=Ciceribacter sp. RN22 TaxID=2954932 RepID=UPI002092A401|nr:AraC family transcriptional regulator [Ciceribacter sp. RN22]MCO6180910.1 AraC family transcriptional regulator [Ciceribacter sp. RN22]
MTDAFPCESHSPPRTAENHTNVDLRLDHEGGIFASIPASVGKRTETPSGAIIDASRPAGSMSFRSNAEFATVMLAPSIGMQSAFASDRVETFDARIGTLIINPAGIDRFLRWDSEKKNVSIAFAQRAYAELAAAELDGATWELRPPAFGHVDVNALRLARVLSGELAGTSINALHIESLLIVLGVHLIRKYSSAKRNPSKPAMTGLSAASAKRVVAYMREHLAKDISVAELAREAQLSRGHFLRAFARSFGVAPHQYLLNLRLLAAEDLLLGTDHPIAEVAYESGFSSQSHLTSVMKRFRQVTPARLRHTR